MVGSFDFEGFFRFFSVFVDGFILCVYGFKISGEVLGSRESKLKWKEFIVLN